MALAAAPHIPGFRALSPLGYGPTSTIFSAQSTSLGRWVALTVYSTTLADDRSQRRFLRAFETARRLGSHPHIVTTLEAGLTPERMPYVVTENYERGTLEARISTRPQLLDVDEVLAVGIALAGALETAHRAGVIHGGLHPGRVLIDDDRVPAIADMNLVPLVVGRLAALVGPRHHAPPEVLEGEELSPATDVFSLASTLYMALTGRPPYQGEDPEADTAASLLLRMLQRTVPPIGRRDVPPSLETRLAQALDSQAANRPAGPLTFVTLLQGIQQELSLPVTEPVVLDVPPGLTVADEVHQPQPNGTASDNLPPDPALPPDPDPALPPLTATTASPLQHPDTPVPRVFVPYQPPEPEAAAPPAAAGPLADVPDFPAPPAPEQPAYEPPAPDPAPPETNGDHWGSSNQWPWAVEGDVDTFDPQPAAPVAVLDSPAYTSPSGGTEPPVDVEPEPEAQPEPAGDAPDRARALPVIVLMSLVAVLVVGVAWMIVTGEDPSPASGSGTTQSTDASDGGAVPPESVTAVEIASGVQIDWDGSSEQAQVVVVLSEAEAPRTLPAEAGSALVVNAAELTPGTGYCFAVAPAPSATSSSSTPAATAIAADLADDAVGPNACIRGATPDSVNRS